MKAIEKEILNVIRNLREYAKCCVDLDKAIDANKLSAEWWSLLVQLKDYNKKQPKGA
jgi:hypothetical protein